MKARTLLIVLFVALFVSGCVVYSFYPLYNDDDLFPNDLLTGQWYDSDSTLWKFEHPYVGNGEDKKPDMLHYKLTMKEKDNADFSKHDFEVNIIKLEGHYFLDFYVSDYETDEIDLFNFHIIPVHTFARLNISDDKAQINWFQPDWLEDLIKQNKIRIHHENNGEIILLTAKPDELQKFVIKYVNSEEAFDEGLEVELKR